MYIGIGNFVIQSDERQYIVGELVTRQEGEKAGEQYIANKRYFSTVQSAAESILERKIKKSDAKTLKEVIDVANEVREEIRKSLEDVEKFEKGDG